uniref:Cytidine and deoxycytidylate deaminase zinc-binding region domain-containing protein, putative n=1 Tax=Neospora caninum (strain Liverpool) TaxID=572307 RepID=A0A0F7UM19_NEOCL|nr:TPA: cytidine and deoxycytidylate deaminase zinc-binding region domain-containing protein, putative [Neospora caninum Liverpool]
MARSAEDTPVSSCHPTVSESSVSRSRRLSESALSSSPACPCLSRALVRSFDALQAQPGPSRPHLEEVVDEIFQLHAPPLISLHALAAPPRLCSTLLQLLQKHHPLQFAETTPQGGQREGSEETQAGDVSAASETETEERDAATEAGLKGGDETEDVCVFVPWWKRKGRRIALHFLKRCKKTEKNGPVLLLLGTAPENLHVEVLECLRTCSPPALPPACAVPVSACHCSSPLQNATSSPPQGLSANAGSSSFSSCSPPQEAEAPAPASAASFFVHVAVPSVPPVTTEQQRLWGEVWPCYLNKTKPSGPKGDAGGGKGEGEGTVEAGEGEGEKEVSASASIRQELLTPLELSEEEKATHLFFLNAAVEISRQEGRSTCIITYTPEADETPTRKSPLPPSRKRQRARTESETDTDTDRDACCAPGHATVERNGGENTGTLTVSSAKAWGRSCRASVSAVATPCRVPTSGHRSVTNGCEAHFGTGRLGLSSDRDSCQVERAVADAFKTCMRSRVGESDQNVPEWKTCKAPNVVAACVDDSGPRAPLLHATMRAIGCVGEKLRRIFEEPDTEAASHRESEIVREPEGGSGAPEGTETTRWIKEVSDGNYYCQGCVVYCSHEPCVLCAMALIHSRIKLLVFAHDNKVHGGITRGRLHLDRRLNHGYRVLCLRANDGASCDQKEN